MNQHLFVCEYLSGGGLDRLPSPAEAGLPAQGLAMRDALLADLARIPGLVLRCAQGDGVSAPRGAEPVQPRPGEAFDDFVLREAAAHDRAWIVAPETGGLLGALARGVAPQRWLGCRPDAIALCSRKRATLQHLAAHGLATPLAWGRAARRWVVKPDDGAGGVDTRVHAGLAEAEADRAAREQRGEPCTLEPWVDGEALSLSLLCAGDGRAELLNINRQHIEVTNDGELRYRGVSIEGLDRQLVRAGALASIARAVVRAVPGLAGFVGIDLVWHAERGPVVIEVNPRLTCAYVGLSAALGRNLAAEVVALHGRGEAARVAA